MLRDVCRGTNRLQSPRCVRGKHGGMHQELPARKMWRIPKMARLQMNSHEIASIKSMINRRSYDEALEACETLLKNGIAHQTQVLRLRASIHSRQGDFNKAINDYELILSSGESELRDYYLAADNALEAMHFVDAASLFEKVLQLGNSESEDWFLSATLFYLSYCKTMIGDLNSAKAYLAQIEATDPSVELFLPGLGISNLNTLRSEITKRDRPTR